MTTSTEPSPLPWSISDSHGLCVVDANNRMVADLTPQSDWVDAPSRETLRANAELIVSVANSRNRNIHV